MKCFYHPLEQAVAQCVDCHKGLCWGCAHQYKTPICPECNNKRIYANLREYLKSLIICSFLYVIGYNLEILGPDKQMGAYMLMCSYAGWRFINRFCPYIFIWFSVKAVFWYFLLKLCISMFIGFFATPFYLAYSLYNVVQLIVLKKKT